MTGLKWLRGAAVVVILLAFLGNAVVPASADGESDVKISKNAALKLAAATLKLPKNFELTDAELVYGPAWDMRGMVKDQASTQSVEFKVDALNGDLLSYRKYGSQSKRSPFSSSYPREKAMASAKAFIAKASPSLKGVTIKEQPVRTKYTEFITPLFGEAAFTFSFEVTYKDIPIEHASITIQLDGSGNLMRYQFTGAVGTPAALTRVKSAEEIGKAFAEKLRVGLGYVYRNSEWKLLYYTYGTSGRFDAVTGQDVFEGEANEENPANFVPVRTEGDVYVPTGAVSSEEKALSIVNGALMPQGVDWEVNKETDIWMLTGKRSTETGYARIDANTGRLLSYRFERDYFGQDQDGQQPDQKFISVGKATEIADRFMNAHVPQFSSEYKRVVSNESDDATNIQITVRYQRVYKGIPVLNAYTYVTVDGYGEVVLYEPMGYWFENKQAEGLSSKISADRAKKMILDAYRIKLVYSNDVTRLNSDSLQRPQALYYVMEDKQPALGLDPYVDAVKGERVRAESFMIIRGGPLPSAYQKHPSAKALQFLFDYGVIETDASGKIYPDKAISRYTFWKMIRAGVYRYAASYSVAAFSDTPVGSDTNNILMFAVEQGWLTSDAKSKFNPNGALTREQMAVWLTSIIGYDKVSEQFVKEPMVTRLKDAGKINNKGAAALMLKLGIMTASGGNFKPQAPVTLAETAETFKRLAEKQSDLDHPFSSNDSSDEW